MNFAEILSRISTRLEGCDIPYMVTGSIAASYYGLTRATQDLDIVISCDATRITHFMEQFPEKDYYAPLGDALDALRHNSMFNVLDMSSSWKIDFIFRKQSPYHLAAFERRTKVTLQRVPTSIVTLEDLIIAKLEWAKLGESERQISDVGTIAQKRSKELDRAYVDRWVDQLGLSDQWTAARKKADLA